MNFGFASFKNLKLKYLLFIVVFVQFSCQKKINTSNSALPDVPLKDTYWKVTEIGDTKTGRGFEDKDLHFILSSKSDIVIGNTGCNSFNGKYNMPGKGILHFSKVASTRMYCPNYEAEPLWFDLIESPMSYKIKGNILTLTNKKNIRAVCEAIFIVEQN